MIDRLFESLRAEGIISAEKMHMKEESGMHMRKAMQKVP